MNKIVFKTVSNFLLAWICFNDGVSAAMLPMNFVVRAGETVEMSCLWDNLSSSAEDSEPIEWYHTPVGSSENKINSDNLIVNAIFNGSTLSGNITGQTLKIKSAQTQHAGLYTCTTMIPSNNDSMTIESAAAHLVILAADPVCQMRSSATQIEYGAFEVCCILSYTGSLVPAMKWRLPNGNNRLKERPLNVTPVISENSAMSTLTIVADFSLNGLPFICETVFEAPPKKSGSKVAENTPEYNYTWTSSNVQVLYGPRNLRVIPAGDVFYPDDNLTCLADGNPDPKVLWLNAETTEVTHGPTVIIKEEMIRDQPYEFICRATNPESNQNQEVTIRFLVKQRCKSSDSALLKILLYATLAVSAVIIASLSLYIAVTKRKRRGFSRAFPVAEGRASDAVNPKTPLSRVSRCNLSLPLPSAKHQPFENSDYLSPRPPPPPPHVDYDEIPYAQAITAQNAMYLEIEPEHTHHQPAAVPFEFTRPVNAYLASAEQDVRPKVYETLKPRE